MAPQPRLVPYLRNVRLWTELMILGGAVVFIAVVILLAALHPAAPVHELTGLENAWPFLLPVLMGGYGLYVSTRYWRCPHCGESLSPKGSVPTRCDSCGHTLRV